MLLTNNNIKLSTRGKLVSTTDLMRAKFLNKTRSIRELVGTSPAHFELIEAGRVLIYARREIYELEVM